MAEPQPPEKSFSESLKDLLEGLPSSGLSLGDLLKKIGTDGPSILCMILTAPFLLPVSIPGSSAPFGLAIATIAAANLCHQPPWLPRILRERRIAREALTVWLTRGARLFSRIEKLTHPRLAILTHKNTVARFNSLVMAFTGLLLMAPLPLPFSNTLPAYGVLFLAVGELERDGYAVLLGYIFCAATVAYFSLIWIFGMTGLRTLA